MLSLIGRFVFTLSSMVIQKNDLELAMFTPKAFKEERFDTIKAFIKEQPLATVVVQTQNGLEACHIPMYWQDDGSEYGCLYGHIAKVNALNDYDNLDAPWLIIFQDAGHYISPNWYPSKAITDKEVPTWNYRSVHIKGSVSLLTDPMVLTEILSELTQDFEANQPIPWSLDDAPENYIQALCRAVVGFGSPDQYLLPLYWPARLRLLFAPHLRPSPLLNLMRVCFG